MHPLTFGLGAKVTQPFAQYPLHHVTYTAAKFEVVTYDVTYNDLGGDAFTKIHCPAAKFETATSNGLGGDAFTRKI